MLIDQLKNVKYMIENVISRKNILETQQKYNLFFLKMFFERIL